MVIAREVTKLHEEFLRGRADEVLAQLEARGEVRGEITLLIGKAEEASVQSFHQDHRPTGKALGA